MKAPGNKLTGHHARTPRRECCRQEEQVRRLGQLRPDQSWDAASIYKYTSESPTVDDFILWMFSRARRLLPPPHPTSSATSAATPPTACASDVRSQKTIDCAGVASRGRVDITVEDREPRLPRMAERHDLRGDRPQGDCRSAAAVAAQSVNHERSPTLYISGRTASGAPVRQAVPSHPKRLNRLHQLQVFRIRSHRRDVGPERYQSDWFRVDQLYRWFTHAYQTADFQKPPALKAEVDKQYANTYPSCRLRGRWQQALEPTGPWKQIQRLTRRFSERHVAPVVKDGRTKGSRHHL